MKFTAEQEDRLARFALLLKGRFPSDEAQRTAHARSARDFELFLLGHGLPFSQESFRAYLLEMHRAAKQPKEERAAEQQRLKLYYHAFSAELFTPVPSPSQTYEETAAAAPPRPPEPPAPEPSAQPPQISVPAEDKTSPQRIPFEDLPAEDEMVCPRCGFRQPRAIECVKCGVVFEKWRNRPGGADAQHALGELRRELEGRLVARPAARTRERSGGDVVLLYLIAPLAAFLLFSLFQSLNNAQRAQLVTAERELIGLTEELTAVDAPPSRRIDCYARTDRPEPFPAPFWLLVPLHLNLSPTEEPSLALSLRPRDPVLSRFEAEELTVSLRRVWNNPDVGTQGLEQSENLWNEETIFRRQWNPKKKDRPPPLEAGAPAWSEEISLAAVVEKPGTYWLSVSIAAWYPRPFQGFRAVYQWSHRSYRCDEAAVEVRSFETARDLRVVLGTQRQGLEQNVRHLKRKERLSRIAKYGFFLALLVLGSLVCYRALVPEREEGKPIRTFE